MKMNMKKAGSTLRKYTSQKEERILRDKFREQNLTRGSMKVWNYLLGITKSKVFIDKVAVIRKKYNIPRVGYKFKLGIDSPFCPPQIWRKQSKNMDAWFNFFDEIKKLSIEIGIHPYDNYLDYYVFFNKLYKPDPWLDQGRHLCHISDIPESLNDWIGRTRFDLDNKSYPVAIRISPYASGRDIIDFIEKKFTTDIKPLLIKYKKNDIKIGKFRSKSPEIQARNNFVYQHRRWSREKISKETGIKFGEKLKADQGNVGKIISLEKKLRK